MQDRDARIVAALREQDLQGLLTLGHDNSSYLSGRVLPFAPNAPDRLAGALTTADGACHLICPMDWANAAGLQGHDHEQIEAYSEATGPGQWSFADALQRLLDRLDLTQARLGLDMERAAKNEVDGLKAELPGVTWVPFDAMLRGLRLVKTPAEVALVEEACRQSELGLIGALNHMEGSMDATGYTLSEFTERVRVHIYETGGSLVGQMDTVQGSDAQLLYAWPRGKFVAGSLVRVDVTNNYLGYWSNGGRMFTVGEPSTAQLQSYRDNLQLKDTAQESLRAGLPASQVFEQVRETALQAGIPFWEEAGVGHGVGVAEREAPFLHPTDDTMLEPGMVVALDVWTYGPAGELIHSKDTFEIQSGGCRLLSWYRDWDRLYATTGFRSAH